MRPVHRAVTVLRRAARPPRGPLILLLHNRYRTPGGEERAVEDLAWLVRDQLGEQSEVFVRDSLALSAPRAAAGLLRGGLEPDAVGEAVRRSGARVVHAHNVHPAFGWRALAAAREAGARVVLHLHNYRLVCAVGTCFTRGEDCTRCHGDQHGAGRAPELPRLARRGGDLRRRARALAAAAGRGRRRLRGAERVRARAAARRSARRSATART